MFKVLHAIRLWSWQRQYQPGRIITRSLAPDIRRDVEVVDASRIHFGVISVRTRTWNVLYAHRGIEPAPPFSPVIEVQLKELWSR